jgi:hypothetical protein
MQSDFVPNRECYPQNGIPGTRYCLAADERSNRRITSNLRKANNSISAKLDNPEKSSHTREGASRGSFKGIGNQERKYWAIICSELNLFNE